MSVATSALYARVSSDQQAQAQTIQSQLSALRERIKADGEVLPPDHEYIDEGYSGSTLVRPALERLRDAVALGEVERVYVYAPDRLARKYAYQVMLVDEFHRSGVELVFLNRALSQSPEDELLLQMQGMIAEYERAQMLERSRRGKRHKAQHGSVNVLSGAPFGYRYISVTEGGGAARYDVIEEHAEVVRQMFRLVGEERFSIGDVKRHLETAEIPSPTGKTWWDRTTIWGILKNPAYQGQAAFGKTRSGELRPRLREQRGRPMQPRRGGSTYDVSSEEWLSIPVPPIVSQELFSAVQEQLQENRQRARQGQRGAKYLLQGLVVCQCCGYAYYGKAISPSARKGNLRHYAYYRCIGSDAYRFGGQRLCDNKQVRTDRLEQRVWQEVCQLLEDPNRLAQEYHHRLEESQKTHDHTNLSHLEKQISKVRQGISRLIDGYAEGYLNKEEFEPRIRRFKERLKALEEQSQNIRLQEQQSMDLQLVIGQLEEFSVQVKSGLQTLDWDGQRNLIRTLVKRVEIGKEQVKVVFRVGEGPLPGTEAPVLPDCWRGAHSSLGSSLIGWQPLL
jgi:site-specific DNA recombinase